MQIIMGLFPLAHGPVQF